MDIVNFLLIFCRCVNTYVPLKVRSKAFMNFILNVKLRACYLSIDENNVILLI